MIYQKVNATRILSAVMRNVVPRVAVRVHVKTLAALAPSVVLQLIAPPASVYLHYRETLKQPAHSVRFVSFDMLC